jgi:hypothetical protein
MKIWPVEKAVGNIKSKGPQLVSPINEEAGAATLL